MIGGSKEGSTENKDRNDGRQCQPTVRTANEPGSWNMFQRLTKDGERKGRRPLVSEETKEKITQKHEALKIKRRRDYHQKRNATTSSERTDRKICWERTTTWMKE